MPDDLSDPQLRERFERAARLHVYKPVHDPLRPGLLGELDSDRAPASDILLLKSPADYYREDLKMRRLGLWVRLGLMIPVGLSIVVVPWWTVIGSILFFIVLGWGAKRDLAAMREIKQRLEPAPARLLKE